MKQKCNKKIVKRFIIIIFLLFVGWLANTFAQYYYFSSGGKNYQQGCEEVLEIRVNSQGQNVRAGRFHLLLDPFTIIYPQTSIVSDLRSFFGASTDTFIQRTSEGSPSWKEGSNYTILQADRNNGTSDYSGSNKLYANVKFTPVFSGGEYDIVFGMEYIPGDSTVETTLSKEGGIELINPEQQELYRTGTFYVLQEPCVTDTDKPTIENISILSGSTKVSYLSGLTFWLKDEGGVSGVGNVPYIWSGGEWTGNIGGIISNQYGINQNKITVELSGNGTGKTIINTSVGVNIGWSGKTWQSNGLNAKVSVAPEGLFAFGTEKKITAKFTFYDRAGRHDTKTITFNNPRGPELIQGSASPKNSDIYVNLSAPIKLGIKDDWAGVNSGTIKIKILGINNTDYGPYEFTGSALNLSGVQGSANKPDYYINIINHEDFPTSGTIKVEVYAQDMEGNVDIIDDYSFSTRPNCTDFQCCNPVWLDLGNKGDTYYYNTGLIISGGNNPVFSVDADNNTGIIDCNAESEGLSVYKGNDFEFFTDSSVLTILGTGVKGVLSGDVLMLSYIIGESYVVIDKPINLEHLSGGEIDIEWHLTGVENQNDWLSGYILQIYSGENLITGGFVDGTGITEILSDGKYEIMVYPIDVLGNTGNSTTGSFVVDTIGPNFEFNDRSGYECDAGYLEIIGINDLLSDVAGLPYSFDGINWTLNNVFVVNSQNITGFASKTGYVRDIVGNISEKAATYEFVDIGVSVDVNDLNLGTLVGDYVTGIINLYGSFGASEGNCGIEKLGLEILSCNNSTGHVSEGNLVINPDPYFEGIGDCILKVSDDDGNERDVSISFEVDTKASSCALLIQNNQCTSGEVVLLLTGDDISGYNRDGSDNWIPWTGLVTTGVYGLGIYSGYVIDGNGNVSGCSVEVTTNSFDNLGFTVSTLQATGYECQIITGYVQVSTGESCGKKNLTDFTYNWNDLGYTNNLSYGTSSNESGMQNIPVSVQDLVGNTENVTVSYIWYDSEIQFNDIEINSVGNGVQEFNWKDRADVRDGDCGSETVEFNGFISTGSHGTCAIGGGDTIIYTPNVGVQYEGSDSCTFEIKDDEGNIQSVTIILNGVDTKKPECSISYNENVCTSGDISLIMSATGASEYSWTGFMDVLTNNLSHNVKTNGIHTGYVRDLAGNTGICTKQVKTFDNVAPIITIPAAVNLTAEECTFIHGNISVIDDGGCGDGFNYLWGGFGYGNGTYYSGYSELVTGKNATVSVRDLAGNIANGTVNYNWTDTGVQLNNGNEQIISAIVLTGGNSYNTTTGDLISLFGASEGNCGPKYISIEKMSCNGLSMDIDVEGNVVVIGNNDLSQIGSCILRFSDNDGNSENGILNIRVDTLAPGIVLEGTNVACMGTNTFDVTGTFTESVQGFTLGNVFVQNGSKINFLGEGEEYTWTVTMNPMVEVIVSVSGGVVTDLNGTENTESNILTGMYDNAGPIAVSLAQPGAKVYASSATLSWSSTIDSGCAGLSGYNWEIYSGSCGDGILHDAGFVVSGDSLEVVVDGLIDSGSYCRRVQPVDNFGNKGEWELGEFLVDLSSIGCKITPVDFECTNGIVNVVLDAATGYTLGTIYLSWVGTGDHTNTNPLYTGLTYSGQTATGYIYQTVTNKWNICEYTADNIIDKSKPIITTLSAESVPECMTGTANIIATDDGCGNTLLTYKWDGNSNFGGDIKYLLWSGKVGEEIVNVQVKDNVGNETGSSVQFEWTNTPITGNNFTGSENVGNSTKTINWRLGSEAIDGACGSGSANVMWSGFISTGDKGECRRIGDDITYTPKLNQTGGDMCKIQLKDDEDSIVNLEIYWEGIDTLAPTCNITKEPESCVSGSVVLTLTATETLKQVAWGDIFWGISGNIATGSAVDNLEYVVEITDLAGNIGSCSGVIDYINTGVLEKPTISISNNLGYTNDNTLDISWNSVSANGCRYVSGYEIQIRFLGEEITGGITNINSWTSPELSDGGYEIKVRTLDNLGGKSEREIVNIIIDTEDPTCTIQFNQACTSGKVQLTMLTQLADYYSWSGFVGMTDYHEVIDVDTNGVYYCYVKDMAGNIGTGLVDVDNIKTGVLSYPNGLTIVGGTPINDNTPEFEWTMPMNDGCRSVSGFGVEILSGGAIVISDVVSGTGWTSDYLDDGEYIIRIETQDTLGGESEGNELSFVIDTIAPDCSVEALTLECTNVEVEIKLSGDVSDIVEYSWWNGTTGNFGSDITTTINQNGGYTGYVYDEAGNEGICTGILGLDILDQEPITNVVNPAVGYECEIITGSVQVSTGNSCGKDQESNFEYLWDGGFTGSRYGIRVDSASGFTVGITITDGAGNIGQNTVDYTWGDTGVALLSGNIQNISLITGDYVIISEELIGLFGATEGACGTGNVTVTGVNCSGASYTFDDGEFTISPTDDLDGVDGYCRFEFGDDEKIKTVVGILEFVVDTVTPELLNLTGNAICAKGGTPWTITGTWSENVEGFELSDIAVTNGTRGNNRISNENPIYVWHVTSPTEGVGTTIVSVLSGKVVDDAGNSNVEDKSISWEFDNVGPNDVTFINWQNVIFTTETTLNWSNVVDSGCAGLSGYNYKFVEGLSCDNVGNIKFITSSSISVINLVHGNYYTLCVQPIDKFGNVGNWSFATLEVNLNAIGCVIEESACSSTGVVLALKPGEGIVGDVSLSWSGYNDLQSVAQLTKVVTESGLLVTGYIQQNSGGEIVRGSCNWTVQNIDQINPIFVSVSEVVGYECDIITGSVEMYDEGCGSGLSLYTYQWNGLEVGSSNEYGIIKNKPWVETIYVTGYDGANNGVNTGVVFTWQDSPIEWNNFTGSINVGNTGKTVNWKELSHVTDGLCGGEKIEFTGFVSSGNKGKCTVIGDNIIYSPNEGEVGDDTCIIKVSDDEGNVEELIVSWRGIDTEKPSCTLTVQEGQSCTSGTVYLVLNSDSNDLSGYSFDGEIFGNLSITGVFATGNYTGYVIDLAGNVSDPCTVEILGGILDLDDPELLVSNWTGYECSTGTIIVTGSDNSCGIDGLVYDWMGIGNNTRINSVYSGNVGTGRADVFVYDGVGHYVSNYVLYTWIDSPINANDFEVGGVGSGEKTVDWKNLSQAQAGDCEVNEIVITGTITGSCVVDGNSITYTPDQGQEGIDICDVVVTDGDSEGVEITITWVGIDTKKPNITLQGGVGATCTNEKTFVVTGVFNEQVQGVLSSILTGENVEIKQFNEVDGSTYVWTIEMLGGTGKVRINSGKVFDLMGNENEGSNELVLGNYDIYDPSIVYLIKPSELEPSYSNSIYFEWTESTDLGCAGGIEYVLEICRDDICQDVDEIQVSETGKTVGSLLNGTGYWRVISKDAYGNSGVSDTRSFVVNSNNPNCWIEEQSQCTVGSVLLTMTGDKNMTILSNGGIDWVGEGTYYTGNSSVNGEVLVIVDDGKGHTGQCEILVSGHDVRGPEIVEQTGTVNECEGTIISIMANDTGCAGISGYIFGGEFGLGVSQTLGELSITSGQVGNIGGIEKLQNVTIFDTLGNSNSAIGFRLTIKDVSPNLSGDHDLGIITGVVDNIDVIAVLGAQEGNCGTGDLQVQLSGCVNASGLLENGILKITPESNFEGNGRCELYVVDNEGSLVTGYILYSIDTVVPGIVLEGTNVACMSTNTFDVTGTFTESVQGFESSDVYVENGTINNFKGNGSVYSWKVNMDPMVEVQVNIPSGVATDLNGIENTVSNILTGLYDNVGPNDVVFTNWQDTIFTTETTLSWNSTKDSGCAGLSGYYYKFVQGTSCSIGKFSFTTNTGIRVNNLSDNGTYTLCVQPVDNFGNVGTLSSGTFVVDLHSISCEIMELSECNNEGVMLTLTGSAPSDLLPLGGIISLSWTGYDDMISNQVLTGEFTQVGIVTGYVKRTFGIDEKVGICAREIQNLDQESPIIESVLEATGYECETITGSIDLSDEGCGNGVISYIWNGLEGTNNFEYGLFSYLGIVRTINVTGSDGVGNSVSTGIKFVWYNSPIQRNNFTGSINVGNGSKTANWREQSNVRDGLCGSGTIAFMWFTNSGTKGECVVDGDIIIYTPFEGQIGSDYCILKVEDDEGSTGAIVVYWDGIDTQKPICNLEVRGGQACTSGTVVLSLNSESSDVAKYSFDGETRSLWASNITTGVVNIGVYTGYVKDNVGNVGVCTGIVGTGILDRDIPTLIVSNWSGFECNTGVVVITGSDDSCGLDGLYYGWEGFDNSTNKSEIYSGKVGNKVVTGIVFDGVGHSTSKSVSYTWNNIPVTGQNFVVQNVGTGITVDWKARGTVYAGNCEEVFVSAINNPKCTTGEDYRLIYLPVQGQTGRDTCNLTISDDDGDNTIVVIFEGIDRKGPTVQLLGGVGVACTNEKTFVVTGVFNEQVQGVSLNILTGENIEIKQFNEVNGNTYRWIVEMKGGTGKVWINSGKVKDLVGNYNEGSNELILGSYDIRGPSPVSLRHPAEGRTFANNSIDFEWTESTDLGCAGDVVYTLEICSDSMCQNLIRYSSVSGTGKTEGSLPNGILYWRIITTDSYGNVGGSSPIQSFVVSSVDPNCTIVEQGLCTTGNVLLILTGDRNVEIINNGGINWHGTGANYTGEIGVNGEIVVVVKDNTGRTGQCNISVSKQDKTGPTFTFNDNNGDECVSGVLSILNVSDNGGCAGLPNRLYKFGGGSWGTVSDYSIAPQQPGRVIVTGYVRDDLGNITAKSAVYTIRDIIPTANNFSIGNIGSTAKTISLAGFIEASDALEGQCGTGALLFGEIKVNGSKGICTIIRDVLTYVPNSNSMGSDVCVVSIKDNENSSKDVTVTFDDIDTVAPICNSWVAIPAGWTSGDVVVVTLTGCSESISGDIQHEFRENTGYTFNFRDGLGNTGSLFVEYTGFDREPPIFNFNSVYGYECQTGLLIISGVVDSGVGMRSLAYSFDGINRSNEFTKVMYSNIATGISVSGYVRDGLGNMGIKQAKYIFQNSEPTATGFTVAAMNGVDVNRKVLSNARDGACGSGTLKARVSGGRIGDCSVSGDILSYRPMNGYVTGIDYCELSIIDDEGSVLSGIKVKFTDINKYPYIKLFQPDNGKILNTGLVRLTWIGVGDTSAISKYVVTIWDARDDRIEEITGSNYSINLRNGSYKWNVYAVFKDGKTGGLSSTYSFYVVSIPFGDSELLTGVKLAKDKCPDGDLSDSYYDSTCDPNGGRHGSAETDMCGVNMSDYSTEQKGAYLYSYMYGITTMCPIWTANLDGYLIRSHFAKMISEFAVNVLGMVPETGKKGCDEFDDINGLNSELRKFAVISCELGLMGLEADGVTPAKSFNPGNYVTRAQFGTVLSRLLFGDTYNVKDESNVGSSKGFWYKNHLEALKRYGVMTKIDGDWPNYLERRGRVMIMLQRADSYGIFAGKVPAKNGVSALFDD